jgi:hypothetical protein
LTESKLTRDSANKSLRQRNDELVNLMNEITDDETKLLEEYKTASAILEEATAIINKDNKTD